MKDRAKNVFPSSILSNKPKYEGENHIRIELREYTELYTEL